MNTPILENKITEIIKSPIKEKKYRAIIIHKPTNKQYTIDFGATSYEHYKDATPLKLYSNLNHLDKNRRRLYYSRHNPDTNYMNANTLSAIFLWPLDE